MKKVSGKFKVERWIRSNQGKSFVASWLAKHLDVTKEVVQETIRTLEANDYIFTREKLYRGTILYRLVEQPGGPHAE